MATTRRMHRVAERVREVVAAELHRTADPRFLLVTITSAAVSKDLRHAKVYWMVSGGDQRRHEVQDAFDAAGGHFRRVIATALDIRFAPEVRFYYDETLDTQDRVNALIAEARAKDGVHSEDERGE